MAIKDIQVHVSDDARCAARVDTAVALAEGHGAHLTGLYTLWVPPMPAYVEAQVGSELVRRQRELYQERAARARAAFDERAARAGLSFEWRCVEGHRAEVLTLSARYCDLLIVSRDEDTGVDNPLGVVEQVVLGSGKPVLVLPTEGGPRGVVGRHAMVAWNGSREAVRAIDSALPLLERAERVDVIAVNPQSASHAEHGEVPGADLATHLARHGVRADVQGVSAPGKGVGETLLARAVADGVDLLVMGAYGHSRWLEVVLGGATAHVLRKAPMPVLMAH